MLQNFYLLPIPIVNSIRGQLFLHLCVPIHAVHLYFAFMALCVSLPLPITLCCVLIHSALPQQRRTKPTLQESEHPLRLCNYLFQVLNGSANNLLLAASLCRRFLLFSGFVITLKVLYIKQNECCKGCSSGCNKLVKRDIKVFQIEQFTAL